VLTPRILISVALVLLMPLGACYRTSSAPDAVSADRSVLTKAEVRSERFASAYDAVEALRGTWLHDRGANSFTHQTEIQVYLDGTRLGGISTLRDIPTTNVESIRYFNGMDASARWGLDHGKGVIYVTSPGGRQVNP
jgi:hypothetical protein